MQLVMYRPGTSAVWADALFGSMLQRCGEPTAVRSGRPSPRRGGRTAAGDALRGWPRSSAITQIPPSRECAGLVEWSVRRSPYRRGLRKTVAEGGWDCPVPACAEGGW